MNIIKSGNKLNGGVIGNAMNNKNLYMLLNLLKILKAYCTSLTRFVYIKYNNVFQGEALLNTKT